MAKGKYEHWISPEGLLKIDGWAKDGLTDETRSEKLRFVIFVEHSMEYLLPQVGQNLLW